jgi:hypothetical protein
VGAAEELANLPISATPFWSFSSPTVETSAALGGSLAPSTTKLAVGSDLERRTPGAAFTPLDTA